MLIGNTAVSLAESGGEAQSAAPAIISRQDWESPKFLKAAIEAKVLYACGKRPATALPHDWLTAAILVVRDRVIEGWMSSIHEAKRSGRKRVYYLSLEFLIGRLFRDTLGNMGMLDPMRDALSGMGVDLEAIANIEPDAALGNGGLGRLAACFMESMATVGISGLGYGIRYDHGLFRQKIVDGFQVEVPEEWLAFRNPWEFLRQEIVHEIGFGGTVKAERNWDGKELHSWRPEESVLGIAYDTPVVGWRGDHINTLRLWSAKAVDPISLDAFNRGDHVGALYERNRAETISRVLYPSDSNPAGQELRLRQEFFFTSASLQDLVRRHMQRFGDIRSIADKVAIQLNDTHPSIAIAELMRILLDIHGLPWVEAWDLTRRATSYTNHTLLPEALETWPVDLMERTLPRHMQIIYAINANFLEEVRLREDIAPEKVATLSLIDEENGRRVRMGNLAFVGSHKINGVSALHSELMKETVFHDLDKVLPGRITNKTNGITPRRWLTHANPGLTRLLSDLVGDDVVDNVELVSGLNKFVDDTSVQEQFRAIKKVNKGRMANLIASQLHLKVNPDAMFDVHVKRIHEYKRQLLNILETIATYQAMRADPNRNWTPRVKIFAGKAAASYVQAKSIIKLINDVARTINADPAVRDILKVVFMPNFNVSLAEVMVPAADLSEQISTAGTEASGTGNMKFALNGAITIGTLDGANVEIRERVGEDNIVIFGLTAAGVEQTWRDGYHPGDIINNTPKLKAVLDAISSGEFSPEDRMRFVPLVNSLYNDDRFLIAADFTSFEQAQRQVDAIWEDQTRWTQMAMRNTANVGWFSSDRTIREYADEIWQVPCDLQPDD